MKRPKCAIPAGGHCFFAAHSQTCLVLLHLLILVKLISTGPKSLNAQTLKIVDQRRTVEFCPAVAQFICIVSSCAAAEIMGTEFFRDRIKTELAGTRMTSRQPLAAQPHSTQYTKSFNGFISVF